MNLHDNFKHVAHAVQNLKVNYLSPDLANLVAFQALTVMFDDRTTTGSAFVFAFENKNNDNNDNKTFQC